MVCYDGGMANEDAATIVTVNAGSSSIKIVIFSKDPASTKVSRLASLVLSGIGQPVSLLQIVRPDMPAQAEELHVANYTTGTSLIIEKLTEFMPVSNVLAVGHRLVHGGIKYTRPTPIKEISEADWQLLAGLDPEHTPAAHHLITQFLQFIPGALQVACFDTAFFQDLPYTAKIVPIPKKYYQAGMRRYGFHGLSYASLLDTFREKAGEEAVNGRVILAHLGSGASMAATYSGKPLDTTMGFTPTSGLVMSTRSGDLDPNVFSFLHRQDGMGLDEFTQMVSFESGLLGVSGISGDMQKLLGLEAQSSDAKAAVDLFVYNVKKSVGALSAILGGVDSLIFSGGIGEQSSVLRTRICQGLGYLGIEINETTNRQNDFLISSPQSRVGVHVIPTDEAQVIAAQTITLLNTSKEV